MLRPTVAAVILALGPGAGAIAQTCPPPFANVKAFGARGDGAADDTAAIQAAINSGASLYFPAGRYRVSSTLNLTTIASHGQLVTGAGATDGNGVMVGKTIIRPTAAVATVFRIDGAPGGYIQSFGFENLTIDMADMADVATSAAFRQAQAFDGHYENVRVIHDGANKRGWLFQTGAYATTLKDTQSNWLDFEGASTANGVTTIMVINHDGGGVIANFANALKFIGGAFQGASGAKFTLRNGTDFQIDTDVEGGGVYLDVDRSVNFLRSSSELQGFTGTYLVGAPAPGSILWDNQANYNTYPAYLTSGYIQLNNQGAQTASSFLSGSASARASITLGRVSGDAVWGVAAAANDFFSGTEPGDTVLETSTKGAIWIAPRHCAAGCIELTATGVNTYGKGAQHAGTLTIQPATDGPALAVLNDAGAVAFAVTTNAAGGVTTTTAVIAPFVRTTPVTYAALTRAADPSPGAGDRAFITDDNAACAFGTPASGGGSTQCPVVYNGAAWVAG